MELTTSEKHSSVWIKVKARLEDKLRTQRLRLEGSLDFDETNRVRGRIAELKGCLAMDEDPLFPAA